MKKSLSSSHRKSVEKVSIEKGKLIWQRNFSKKKKDFSSQECLKKCNLILMVAYFLSFLLDIGF